MSMTQQGNRQPNRANGQQQSRQPQFDTAKELRAFRDYVTSADTKADYSKFLGQDINVDRFIQIAIDAVEQNPGLLNPEYGESVWIALKKAARQGLRPDGKEGALIPRKSRERGVKEVQWQPMVWGIVKAGRRANALKKLTADIVFAGEPFRFIRGDEERIEHEWMPEMRSKAYQHLRPVPSDGYEQESNRFNLVAFWDQVVTAYCIIEQPDGTKVRRAMSRERLLNLRDFSAAQGGPWNGVFVDEMILKAVILYTTKYIETDSTDERVKAFRDALEQDMDIALGEEDSENDRTIEHETAPPASTGMRSLPAPSQTLDNLTERVVGNQQSQQQREPVPAGNGGQEMQERRQEAPQGQQGPSQQSQQQQEPQGRQEPQGDQQQTQQREAPTGGQDAQQQPQQQAEGQQQGNTTKAQSGSEVAQKWANYFITKTWENATMAPDGIAALANFYADSKNNNTLMRLRNSYAGLYRNIVMSFLRDAVFGKIEGLKSVCPTLHEDILYEAQAAQQQRAA